MRGRWLSGFAFALLAATYGVAQQSGGQVDPWNGGGGYGASGAPPINSSPDLPSGSRRADEGAGLVFKSQTTLVEVPVVVADKAGGHVHGLSKSDFKVLEDGKEQRLAGFEEVIPASGNLSLSSGPAGTFSNIHLEGPQPHSVTVVVLDMVNTPFLDQSYARGQLMKYLADHLDSTHAMGLMAISSKGLTVLSGLTTDPAMLISTLKKVSGQTSAMERFQPAAQAAASTADVPSGLLGGISANKSPDEVFRRFVLKGDALEGSYQQARAIETTLQAFLSIAWSLSGVPGRKSLVWATGSFPFYLDSFGDVPGDRALRTLYERAMKALNDAEIAVYPLDVRGVLTDPAYSGSDSVSALQPGDTTPLQQSSVNTLNNFAAMTGGRAYYGNNDLITALKHAEEDSSSYYLLSYYLNTRNAKPGWRKLQVLVSSKDAEVRARAGFLLTNASVNPEVTHKSDIEFALNSPFESTGIAITEHWQDVSPDGNKKKIVFAMQVPATDLIEEGDKNRFDVEFVARATEKGVIGDTVGQTINGIVPQSALDKIKAEGVFYRNSLKLAPGSYQVQFVVRDNLSGRIGSLIVPLTVN